MGIITLGILMKAKRYIIISMIILININFLINISYGLDSKRKLTQYIHKIWQIENGIPQNTVQAILQTRNGYLWFGTQEGLVRYDGINFKVFDRRNTHEIKHNSIWCLYEDKRGNLWIGTKGGGLNKYSNGKFELFTIEDGLSSDNISAIKEDRSGNLWIGTFDAGINCLSGGKIYHIHSKDGLSSDKIVSIIHDRFGYMWIATKDNGLNRYNKGKIQIYNEKQGLKSNNISSIYEDKQGNLWVATIGSGLYQLKNGEFIPYYINTDDGKNGIKTYNDVKTIFQDKEDCIWIGTNGAGVIRLNNDKFSSFTTKEGLSSDRVLSFYEDNEGSLWIGTNNGGLNLLSDSKFINYGFKEGLNDDIVWSIFEDKNKNIWIGTLGGGINCISRNGNSIKKYTVKEGLSSERVLTIHEDSKGNLWVGTLGAGLYTFSNGIFKPYNANDGLTSDSITSIFEDCHYNLWVGTLSGGLYKYDNGRFSAITTKDGLSNDKILTVYKDSKCNLWIGTNDGLNLFKDGKFTIYKEEEGLSNNMISAIYEDSEKNLWIGTNGGGLNRFVNGKFKSYTTKDGLFNDAVYCILEDKSNNLWMSCNKGIYHINKKDIDKYDHGIIKKIPCVNYDISDGLRSVECNGGTQNNALIDSKGNFWFSTIKGAAYINPENIKINETKPTVHIENIQFDNVELDKDYFYEVKYGIKNYVFKYAALSYIYPKKINFKYKLIGFDENWIEAKNEHIAKYTNLPYGYYIFSVVACNNDNIWNLKGKSFSFEVLPPFWQTWWFNTLTAFLVFSIIGLIFWYVIYRIRKKNAIKEEQRRKEAEQRINALIKDKQLLEKDKQLLEKDKQLVKQEHLANLGKLAAGIAHEIKNQLNPLSLASLISDEARDNPIIKKYSYYILEAQARILSIVEEFRLIAKNETSKYSFSKHTLDDFLRKGIPIFKIDPDVKKCELKFDLNSNSNIIIDSNKIFQVLINLFRNAAQAIDSDGLIILKTATADNNVQISITDNGRGIPDEIIHKIWKPFFSTKKNDGTGLGLDICRQIINKHKGTITCDSKVDKGTTFTITLPTADEFSKYNIPSEDALEH